MDGRNLFVKPTGSPAPESNNVDREHANGRLILYKIIFLEFWVILPAV